MRRSLRFIPALILGTFFLHPAAAQEARRWNYRAVKYDVTATIRPADQTLDGQAFVEFESLQASRVLEVELHANLKVKSVTGVDGKPVPFERDQDNYLRLRVTLPEALPAGSKTLLTFDYSGILASEENSPVKDVRLAYIAKDGGYLLLPSRWFPLTDYPANRYAATFNIVVPENLSVAGTGKFSGSTPVRAGTAPAGKAAAPAVASPARAAHKFVADKPEPAGTFIFGNLRVTPVNAAGVTIPVYASEGGVEKAAEYGQTVANILDFFNGTFGPLPQPGLGLGQLPEGSPAGYSAPGLLLLGKRQWTEQVNTRLLARLAAEQWWGNQVLPATRNDVWISDALARYSEALYVQKEAGEEGFNRALEDFAVGAITYESAAPIAQAARLAPYSSEYNSVVLNKGALVFHMLRAQIGDDLFNAIMRDFYTKFAGHSARIEDFQKVAQALADAKKTENQPALNLGPFFVNWLNSTGLPEFKLEYVVIRTQKGFKVTGKVRQDLETFRMPVQVKVNTDGNPEMKTIDVVGANSDFTVEAFGRPKPGGIVLDPNNHILKSSPRLRLRATIARGEELAEQGRFYDAVLEYQQALEIQKNNALASFRMGEAFFYQKNYQAAANAFREALDGEMDLSYRWISVWSHIYIGKIFDLSGQRERAINEYTKAQQTNDNTGGAQAEVEKLLKEPFKG